MTGCDTVCCLCCISVTPCVFIVDTGWQCSHVMYFNVNLVRTLKNFSVGQRNPTQVSSIHQQLSCIYWPSLLMMTPSPLLDNIRVMMIVWRLRGNFIITALCWIVWHNVHSQQHTYMSSSYRSNRLGLSHWDPYAVCRGSCLELCYCNMLEWFWWDSSLISTTNWFPSVLWHCWFGHLACKIVPEMTYCVLSGTLSLYTTTAVWSSKNQISIDCNVVVLLHLQNLSFSFSLFLVCSRALKSTL